MTNDIKCFTTAPTDPPTFSSYYQRFIATDKFKLIDPGIIAQTTLATMDTGWSITVTDNLGAISATEILSPSAQAASSIVATPAQPVASETVNPETF
jgi:hypothetical protein